MNRILGFSTLLALSCAVPSAVFAADAVIASVDGPATVIAGGARAPAAARAVLPPGGRIATGAGASVVVRLADGSQIRVGENTTFAFQDESASDTNLRLLKGFLTGWIRHRTDRRLNIRTPSAVASVRGTVLTVKVAGQNATIDLYQGAVWVTDRFGRSTVMEPNQRADVRYDGGLTGTSSLPAGANAPEEPVASAPPPAAPPAAPAQEPPLEVVSQPAPVDAAIAAPPPVQQTTVVSPSAP